MRRQSKLSKLTADDLLKRTRRDLVVPLRYVNDSNGVAVIGEYPLYPAASISAVTYGGSMEESIEESRRMLLEWLRSPRKCNAVLDAEQVECALADTVRDWTSVDDHWIVPSGSLSPVELHVRRVSRGLRVEGNLDGGESYGPVERRALSEFLCRAQSALRFSRIEWHEGVRAVAEVDADHLDRNFGHCLMSVAEVARQLAAEVRAMSTSVVAQAYLENICATPMTGHWRSTKRIHPAPEQRASTPID
jgi:hypothetical protein